MTTLPLPLHYIEVSLSFTSIHLDQSSFNVIHLHPFSFIHLSTFIHLHSLLSTLIHFHPLPSSILIVWFQKISIPPPHPNPHEKSLEIPRGRGVHGKLLFQLVKESSVGEVWIFSGTTHSPSFYKTLQVLWCRLTFTHFTSTTFKIDNKKLKNTMEGECDPTGNNENSGIIKDFSIIPLQ